MRVKVIDEEHESDLEDAINDFLEDHNDIVDIKFSSAVSLYSEEQVFCFSALIMYND